MHKIRRSIPSRVIKQRYIKKTFDEMMKQNKRLEIINKIARSINIKMSYEQIIDSLAEPLRQIMPYDLLSFCLLENEQLIIKSGIPKDQQVLGVGTILDKKNSAPWVAVLSKKCILRQDIYNIPHRYSEDTYFKLLGIQSIIIAPMLVRGEVIGTLNFGSKHPFIYSESDFIFAQQLADQLAVCLANTSLYNQVLQSKKVWESTFRAVPELLFTINRNFDLLNINCYEFNGQPTDKFLNKKCYQVFCKGSKHEYCPAERAFQTGQKAFAEIIKSPDQIFHASAFPILSSDQHILGVVCYVEEVTDKLKMRAQLFQSGKLAALGEMAAGVAHELNNPLTVILGNTLLLMRKTSHHQPQYRLLSDLKKCGERCQKVIQNLLTFSRPDKQSYNGETNLNLVLENSLSLVRYQIEKSNIDFTVKMAPDLPNVWGSKQQLEHVLINLLLNARDALESKKDDKKITIKTGVMENKEVFLAIRDNGCGIPEEKITHIFSPFFTTKGVQKGTGLGLSVSLGIVEAHGGRIEVYSDEGKGSIFVLILPLFEGEIDEKTS